MTRRLRCERNESAASAHGHDEGCYVAAPSPAETLTLDSIMLALRRIQPKVIESPWVPDDAVYIVNDLGRDVRHPAGWESMTAEQKVKWAVDNGMAIVVRSAG